MPYAGGLNRYVELCREVVAKNYQRFVFGAVGDRQPAPSAAA
jgi:hypothetical protein